MTDPAYLAAVRESYDTVAADYWRGLYAATIVLLVVFRLLVPLVAAFRFRLRVVAVEDEAPGVVSLWIAGRGLEGLRPQPGQFFLWRFLTPNSWWKAHPLHSPPARSGH